jgi:hypothetical protein
MGYYLEASNGSAKLHDTFSAANGGRLPVRPRDLGLAADLLYRHR